MGKDCEVRHGAERKWCVSELWFAWFRGCVTAITSGEFKSNTAETAGSKKSTWPVPFYALAQGLRRACANLAQMFDPELTTF